MNKSCGKEIRKIAVSLFVMMMLVMLNVCNVSAAQLNKKSIILVKGKSYTLKISGTSKKATWKISKKAVAKLTSKKKKSVKIKAVRRGKATVSAKVGKKTYRCKVTVVDPKLNKSEITLKVEQQSVLSISGGTGKSSWKSSNSGVAKVDAVGKVTAVKIGKATITAIRNGKKMKCVVKVLATNNSGDSTESENAEGKKKVEKKRWVVTEVARTEYIAVYESVGYIECLACGTRFYGDTMVADYNDHASAHLENGVGGGYTVGSEDKIIRWDTVEHPEKGYWETYWVYE